MRVLIAAVGRPRDGALAAAIRDYESRAARYWPLETIEVKSERGDGASGLSMIRQREGERLLRAVSDRNGTVVACDPAGATMTSEAFAAWLAESRDLARNVCFVIGGAFGLADDVLSRANMKLALAPWTLSHELARLVLAEQVYRAGTINRGEPYHK